MFSQRDEVYYVADHTAGGWGDHPDAGGWFPEHTSTDECPRGDVRGTIHGDEDEEVDFFFGWADVTSAYVTGTHDGSSGGTDLVVAWPFDDMDVGKGGFAALRCGRCDAAWPSPDSSPAV